MVSQVKLYSVCVSYLTIVLKHGFSCSIIILYKKYFLALFVLFGVLEALFCQLRSTRLYFSQKCFLKWNCTQIVCTVLNYSIETCFSCSIISFRMQPWVRFPAVAEAFLPFDCIRLICPVRVNILSKLFSLTFHCCSHMPSCLPSIWPSFHSPPSKLLFFFPLLHYINQEV